MLAALLIWLAGSVAALALEEFKLKDGTVIKADSYSMNAQGMTFRLSDPPPGKSAFTSRYPWPEFSQETLRALRDSDPKAAPYVRILVLPTAEELQAQMEAQLAMPSADPKRVEIVIGERPSPGRPHAGAGLIGSFFSGAGLVLLLIFYAGNVYASYEIGLFRYYPGWMVAGISAVAPFLTPIVFLCMPRKRLVPLEEDLEEEVDEEAEAEQAAMEAALAAAAVPQEPVVPEAPPIPPTKVYKRGEFNINRRFIETKFAGFFRAIPSDDERDLNLIIKSARGEFFGRRILKITNTELTFQVPKSEGATVDEVIPLNDILEVHVRHKAATD